MLRWVLVKPSLRLITEFTRFSIMDVKFQCVLFILFGIFAGSVESSIFRDMEPGTVLSRYDYDYNMLKKLLDLETQLADLKDKVADLEAKSGSDEMTKCEDGWLAYKGSCYLLGQNGVDFSRAKEYCILQDAYLVRVETAQENVFLKTFMDNHLNENADYWLGMNDDSTEGVWEFTDTDKEVPYLDWGGTEPQDAGSGEDCAAFGYLLQYSWKDVPCGSHRRLLCEKRN